ncbi:hypothetical protein SAMN02745121_02500 [Nannocystis exedens]|uniref:Tetratricopeptide repeat-containing protein n=1 Tax=Nannocystis exedens TaxID=54 RepID=A0A1I1WSW7_9BACT|nr:hypothetical protein NAEX_04098 [Nannocystis exedens]SFD98122.1 hypothetical protein SAMN02745121_02500 [Nannocystis exedens]
MRRAIALQDKALDADDPRRFEALLCLALVLREREPAEALAVAERALTLLPAAHPGLEPAAELHETLAIARVRSGGDRSQARASACLSDQLRRQAGDASPASRKPLAASKLLTPPCP